MVRSIFVSLALSILAVPLGALAGTCDYGADTCVQGFVWREAYPGDHVCVTPDIRSAAAADNAAAASRRQPGGGAFGPDTCKQGYVWRQAISTDHVCVAPLVRQRAAQDNSAASYRFVCSCTLPYYTYTEQWFGTAPFCSGDCPSEWTLVRKASSGSGCDPSKKGLCNVCNQDFGSSCWSGQKVLCRSNVASVTQS